VFMRPREIKPWLPSYPQELQKAIEQGASAEEKLKYPMPAKFNVGTSVVYQNKECGQFVQSVEARSVGRRVVGRMC
jgi:hypothetical protein